MNDILKHLLRPAKKFFHFFRTCIDRISLNVWRHPLIIHLTFRKASIILSSTLQSQCSNNIFIVRLFFTICQEHEEFPEQMGKRLGKRQKKTETTWAQRIKVFISCNHWFWMLRVRGSLYYLVIVTRGAFLITVYSQVKRDKSYKHKKPSTNDLNLMVRVCNGKFRM